MCKQTIAASNLDESSKSNYRADPYCELEEEGCMNLGDMAREFEPHTNDSAEKKFKGSSDKYIERPPKMQITDHEHKSAVIFSFLKKLEFQWHL